jgi:hypothetical protein
VEFIAPRPAWASESCHLVDQIEIDLETQTAVCVQEARDWGINITVFNDIKQTLDDTLLHGTSLEFKYGADDSRHKTFSYDQIHEPVKKYNSQEEIVSRRPACSDFTRVRHRQKERYKTFRIQASSRSSTRSTTAVNVVVDRHVNDTPRHV